MDYWSGTIPGSAKTFEEYVNIAITRICVDGSYSPSFECRNKDFIGPWGSWPCRTNTALNDCTILTNKSADNKGGSYYYAYHQKHPSWNSYHYAIGGGLIFHVYLCPINYSKYYPNSNYEFILCKPNYPTFDVDLGCPSSICKNSLALQAQGVVTVADPINASSGNKYDIFNDFTYKSFIPFTFNRIYNSKRRLWSHEYKRELGYSSNSIGQFLVLNRPNGDVLTFKNTSGAWLAVNSNNQLAVNSNNQFEILSVSLSKIQIKNDLNEIETYQNLNASTTITDSTFQLKS